MLQMLRVHKSTYEGTLLGPYVRLTFPGTFSLLLQRYSFHFSLNFNACAYDELATHRLKCDTHTHTHAHTHTHTHCVCASVSRMRVCMRQVPLVVWSLEITTRAARKGGSKGTYNTSQNVWTYMFVCPLPTPTPFLTKCRSWRCQRQQGAWTVRQITWTYIVTLSSTEPNSPLPSLLSAGLGRVWRRQGDWISGQFAWECMLSHSSPTPL